MHSCSLDYHACLTRPVLEPHKPDPTWCARWVKQAFVGSFSFLALSIDYMFIRPRQECLCNITYQTQSCWKTERSYQATSTSTNQMTEVHKPCVCCFRSIYRIMQRLWETSLLKERVRAFSLLSEHCGALAQGLSQTTCSLCRLHQQHPISKASLSSVYCRCFPNRISYLLYRSH